MVSKQQTADFRTKFPAHATEKRISNQFPRPEPQVVKIPIGREFIVFCDELPNIHQIIPRGLRNLEFHP